MSPVDHNASRQIADALRAFAAGQITNDEFEDRLPDSGDPLVRIAENYGWSLYPDHKSIYAKGEYALSKTVKAEIARLVLMLRSDQDFPWPRSKPSMTLNILTLGSARRRWTQTHGKRAKAMDLAAWPFASRQALKCEAKVQAESWGRSLRQPLD